MIPVVALGIAVFRGGILLLLLLGLRRRNASLVVNAAAGLGATFLPAGVELGARAGLGTSILLGSDLALWIGLAGFLHGLGMAGLYESTEWWDHLTHTVSASFVAAVVYACLLVLEWRAVAGPLDPALVGGVTLLYTLAAGVFWELLELGARDLSARLGIESILIPYGRRDTVLDLVFDGAGAVLVLALDLRLFVPLFAPAPGVARWLLVAGGTIVLLGSLLLAGVVVYGRTPDG